MLSTKMIDTIPRLIAQDFDPRHYLASPLYGDFSGLPPVHIFSGTADILFVQALLLVERLKKRPYLTRVARDRMHVMGADAPAAGQGSPGALIRAVAGDRDRREAAFALRAKSQSRERRLARLQRSEPRCFCRFGVRPSAARGGDVS